MIASPPIETAVDWPSPAALRVEDISVVIPPEREITPTGPPPPPAARAARARPGAASHPGPPLGPPATSPGVGWPAPARLAAGRPAGAARGGPGPAALGPGGSGWAASAGRRRTPPRPT